MTDDHDIHDLRGEIGGVRGDIRALRDEVRAGFDKMDNRVRKTEDALVASAARAEERAKLLSSGQVVHVERPPIQRDPRTYAVGGVGIAIATVVMEFIRALTTAPK